jgi:hypothetical protein
MYSNSSILTSSKIQTNIDDFITSQNEYFNTDRFSNIHTVIFIASIVFFFLLFILRYTLFSLISRLGTLFCKNLKDKMISQEIVSDDFYRDLSVLQLCKEFNKTSKELKEYELLQLEGAGNQDDMKLYVKKIEKKLNEMEECFKELFIKYKIQYEG